VIRGNLARIDLRAIGLRLQAVIRVRTTREHTKSYVKLFESTPQVLDVVRVSDDDCFIVRCAFSHRTCAIPSGIEGGFWKALLAELL
jgi:Lrp/AsnC family transcriptional regulator, leucine-responsive regulatory protein